MMSVIRELAKSMSENISIYELLETDDKYVEAVNSLLGQLSSTPRCFSMASLEAIVNSENSHLLLAEVDGKVAGMLTLSHYLAPTGLKMWIEDVVVDEAMRGRSLGRRLVERAVEYARTLGPGTLMLTSRPSREAANALYRSCGFSFKETNNYTMKITMEKAEQD